MAGFSIAEAAFSGFHVATTRPRALAIWAAVQLVLSVVFAVLMTVMAGRTLMQARVMNLRTPPDPAQAIARFQHLLPLYGLILLFSLVFYPVLYAAMNRAVLAPADDRFGYLRLGADELRQLLLAVVYGAMFFGIYLAFAIVTGIVAAIAAAIGGSIVGGVVIAVLLIGGLAGFLFLAVRLSLSSALTFATRKLNLFDSWAMTRGRFWPMFGAYLLATLAVLLVSVVVVALSAAVAVSLGGGTGALSLFMRPDTSSLAAYFSPTRIIYLVLSALAAALIWPLLLTPSATIYRSLAGAYGHPAGADGAFASVFS